VTPPRESLTALEELTREECWELLRLAEIGRFAVCIYGQPQIFPVKYLVEDRSIVVKTAAGTTLASAVLGRQVAFEIDGCDPNTGEAWSVLATGSAIEVGGQGAEFEARIELFVTADLMRSPWHPSPEPRYVRLRIDEVNGERSR
jgi:nitroimidazol reductase NimA-like FMN-containing flavoprotein (pyridoxamine 5'-phosphate oxidase superfamily)